MKHEIKHEMNLVTKESGKGQLREMPRWPESSTLKLLKDLYTL